MDAKSQKKVTDAGFVIIRKDDQPTPRIKFKGSETVDWRTLCKYGSKAERDRAFDRYLESNKTIQD